MKNGHVADRCWELHPELRKVKKAHAVEEGDIELRSIDLEALEALPAECGKTIQANTHNKYAGLTAESDSEEDVCDDAEVSTQESMLPLRQGGSKKPTRNKRKVRAMGRGEQQIERRSEELKSAINPNLKVEKFEPPIELHRSLKVQNDEGLYAGKDRLQKKFIQVHPQAEPARVLQTCVQCNVGGGSSEEPDATRGAYEATKGH